MIEPSSAGSVVGSSVFDSRRAVTRFFVEGRESLICFSASMIELEVAPGLRGLVELKTLEGILEGGSGIPSIRRNSMALLRRVLSQREPSQWRSLVRKLLCLMRLKR